MDATPGDGAQVRPACTECQRRKQKCNRQWPCNHCQKRKVADRCRFSHVATPSSENAPSSSNRKRSRARNQQPESSDDDDDDDDDDDFAALGYGGAHFFSNPVKQEKKIRPPAKQYYTTATDCHQLQRALEVLPPRTTTDSLVQSFLSRVNYHYYMIYPPAFLQDYREWWLARSASQPLGLQWTCLLLTVCACSAQYADADLKRKLETELGEPIHRLSNHYHNTARELHSAIPISSNHIFNVQLLLHSSYWYISEARFVESWHALSTAVREAQALGMHQDQLAGLISEFDFEMRRRLWCVLDAWDWQISALLSRPKLIDRSECKVSLPTLTLENYSPSPLLHIKLQSEIIGQLSSRFGSPGEVTSLPQIRQYTQTINSWMQRFPKVYAINDPDTSVDYTYSWVTLHRHYLHTVAYTMLMDPLRTYMARQMTADSSADSLRIRDEAVGYTLKLMSHLRLFFDHLYPRDCKFHWVLFCIFDTAAVLCSAILHDEDGRLCRRDEVLMAIESAQSMLERLSTETRTAKTSFGILSKLVKRIENPYLPVMRGNSSRHQQHVNLAAESLTPPFMTQNGEFVIGSSEVGSTDDLDRHSASPMGSGGVANSISSASPSYGTGYPDVSTGYQMAAATSTFAASNAQDVSCTMHPFSQTVGEGGLMPAPPNPYMPPTPRGSFTHLSFEGFSEEQLGELASLWNYQSLDLNFVPSQV